MVVLRRFPYFIVLSIALTVRAHGQDQEDNLQTIDQPSPVALIGARCVFCHGPVVMLSFSRELLDEAGPEALNTFLKRHHAPDEKARDAIVEFLSNPSGTSN